MVKKTKGKLSRLIACCMAAIMTLGTGTAGIVGEAYSPYAAGIESVKITESAFPDPIFRSYVSSAFDSDKNGILDPDEILVARNIYCDNMGIKSLQGIEHLVELRGVYASFNELTVLDLSKNPEITGVWVSNNKFSKLDFSQNAKTLEWVYCFDNPTLKVLDLSGCSKLSYLECSECDLGELDVSGFPALEHLICASCGLKELDLSGNPKLTHLDAFNNPDNGFDYPLNNKLTELDLSGNPKMKRLDIWANYDLKFVDTSVCPGLQYYNCAMIGADHVDVSKNPELIKLNCAYNKKIRSLDLSHNPKLCYLDCSDNRLTGLDLSKNPKMYFLQAFINSFTTLDIGYNPLLIKTRNEGKKEPVYNIAHAWILDYGGDDSTGGDHIYEVCYDDKVKLYTTPKYKITEKAEVIIPSGVSKDELITREKAVQLLYDIAGRPGVKGKSRFKDVKKGAWYEDALIWGEKNAICIGTPDVSSDEFGIGELVTRQDFALMLMRYAESKGYKRAIDFGRSDDFLDYYDIDYYAWEAICWAATWNIMIGKGEPGAPKEERRIEPHTAATRTDIREMLDRMFEVNNKHLRLAGSDRYSTAAVISDASFTSADTVVLACSTNYADALAGVPLAYKLKAPILLTNPNGLDKAALNEIKRLGAAKIKILGGEGAISSKVVDELVSSGIKRTNIERIAGKTRFGTAAAIAEKLGSPKDVFFVYGQKYADALSVSTVAAVKNAPVIYLSTSGDIDGETKAYLAKLKDKSCVKNAYVIGGEGVISNDMADKAAKALGLSKAARLAGKDRYATCVAVNKKFAGVLKGEMICVATGADFPDALAGGVYAAINKAPLFLINGKDKTLKLSAEQKAYLKTKGTSTITTFGGIGAVPESHIANIAKSSS